MVFVPGVPRTWCKRTMAVGHSLTLKLRNARFRLLIVEPVHCSTMYVLNRYTPKHKLKPPLWAV